MTWNVTFLDNVTSTSDVVIGTNNMVHGFWAMLILAAMWVIIMMISVAREPSRYQDALIGASFATLILSFIFWLMTLIDWRIILIPLVLTIFSVLLKKFSEQN